MSAPPFVAVLPLAGELPRDSRLGGMASRVLLFGGWPARISPVFHAVGGQFHEGRLKRGADHRQLVQPYAVLERDVADLRRVKPVHDQRAVVPRRGTALRLSQRLSQQVRLRGGHPDSLAGTVGDELVHGAISQEL